MASKLKNTKQPEIEPDTKERLLLAAEELFAERGYSGATVKEIADRAGVNISLISYHFNGKEGVLRASVERFGRERLQDTQHYLTSPENLEDMRAKLRLWMIQFLRVHVEQGNVCSILHRENVDQNPILWEVFESTFLKGFEAVAKFFEAGKKKGIVKKEIDPVLAAGMVYGSIIHLGKGQAVQEKWMGISIKNEKYRAQAAEQLVSMLLNGIT